MIKAVDIQAELAGRPVLHERGKETTAAEAKAAFGPRVPWDWRVQPSMVRQQSPIAADAFGDGVDQASAGLEDARCARERLTARGPQECRLEIHGDPSPVAAAARGDGEPDRHVGGCHEDRPADGPAGAFELDTERHFDRALAGADLKQSELVVCVERSAGEPALQLPPAGGECHPRAAGTDRSVGRALLSNDESDRQGKKCSHDDVEDS